MVEIRKLQPSDGKLAHALFAFFLREDGKTFSTLPPEKQIEKMLYRDDFHVWVAQDPGNMNIIVGGLTGFEVEQYKYMHREFFMYEIAVKYSYRRKGVGKQLLLAAKEFCHDNKLDEMFSFTLEGNDAAMKLCSRQGGVPERHGVRFTFKIR